MSYILGIIGGALLNRIRGGWWLDWIKLPTDSPFRGAGVWLPAAAIFIFILPYGLIAAGATAGLYVLGESWGWTKWIRGITGLRDPQVPGAPMTQEIWNITQYRVDDTGQKNGIHAIANTLVKENVNYWWYCFAAMVIRGVYWWGPMYAAMWWFGVCYAPTAVFCVIVLSFLFPVIYWAAANVELFGLRYLQKAEYAYGAVYGFIFMLAMNDKWLDVITVPGVGSI